MGEFKKAREEFEDEIKKGAEDLEIQEAKEKEERRKKEEGDS